MIDATPLETELKAMIRRSGPMPVWRYMELCLSHPKHGYYVSRDPLGREGDFITAPEVSQMFGEIIGLWSAAAWNAMGAPDHVKLIELGPGNGTMMSDALRAIRVLPPFFQAAEVHLVEINASAARKAARRACQGKKDVSWHASLDGVPPGPDRSYSPTNISTCCRSIRW